MAAVGPGALLFGLDHFSVGDRPERIGSEDQLEGTLRFLNEGPAEMDTALGSELDGRLFTTLDGLAENQLVTPEERFYIRTRASRILPEATGWNVRVDGLTAMKSTIPIAKLRELERPLGLHLMECAGNTRAAHFGMISVGEWSGVPIADVIDQRKPLVATRVLVSGYDTYVGSSVTSVPGASWIFTIEELRKAGAFLATRLDAKPLSPDHGAPVRLVVPGWYGCACIKWVDRITFVDEDAEATSQMTEYAGRTDQNGSPKLARQFAPARMDHAAMPVRVEKWRKAGKVKYRVVGILWGGAETVRRLGIRFNPEEAYVAVGELKVPQTTPWTLWSHWWSPAERGGYTIRLAVLEPVVQAKRLESGYYARSVEIEEI